MAKNPLLTAIVGLLVGVFLGYVIGQQQPRPQPHVHRADPHAGVPGAPPLGNPGMPPEGGRTQATANPRLMEQVRELDRLLAQDPNDYQHLVQAGNVHYDLGNFHRAVEYYEKARTVRDDSADVLTDLGVAYRETGRPQQAVELFDRAADLHPEHWQSRYNAAVVRLYDLDDPAGARSELDRLKAIRGTQGIPDLSGLEEEIAKRSQ
jgi:hypothetical protein